MTDGLIVEGVNSQQPQAARQEGQTLSETGTSSVSSVNMETLRRQVATLRKENTHTKITKVAGVAEAMETETFLVPTLGVSNEEFLRAEDALAEVLIGLIAISDSCGIDIGQAALRKIEKNRIKYPAELVKGSSSKYTEYSASGRSQAFHVPFREEDYYRHAKGWQSVELSSITEAMRAFAEERDWNQYHLPRNLALALTGELGELCECFQWKGEVDVGLRDWTIKDKVHLGEELSDCLLYLSRLADQCGLNLDTIMKKKVGSC